ncbi:predicted protein [Sclerotinia sclerotiorum 1980 UF-70]|uniref:Uncharacterized protein n=1 Tax=Sclerotinia sclerotiorum (strain ATCC 18683 / 1980 / Ss-1) TaxID=665079 RepID=A7EBH6_SCLS1|nr:predicted protein [Sclerotinia sclerotiorum 1980 UF-70]EDN99804.1 predicted protein [Sclerotinia sclerotiorum 1980 UF-70]
MFTQQRVGKSSFELRGQRVAIKRIEKSKCLDEGTEYDTSTVFGYAITKGLRGQDA